MALRNLRFEGDPVLNKVAKEVKELTPRVKDLIGDLLETMYHENGVGLAAPQVGILKRICVKGLMYLSIRKLSKPAEARPVMKAA